PRFPDRAEPRHSLWFPSIRIADTHSGSPSAAEDEAIRVRIRESCARVLLLAYGMPAQERWLSRNLPRLPSVIVAIGVGGVFDQLAGRVPMPPPLSRAVGFEDRKS